LPSYHHRPSAVCGQVPTATDIISLAVAATPSPSARRVFCGQRSNCPLLISFPPPLISRSYRQRRRWRIRGCRIEDRRTRSPLPNQLTASHHDAGDMPPSRRWRASSPADPPPWSLPTQPILPLAPPGDTDPTPTLRRYSVTDLTDCVRTVPGIWHAGPPSTVIPRSSRQALLSLPPVPQPG
jgi:hypothetical protein